MRAQCHWTTNFFDFFFFSFFFSYLSTVDVFIIYVTLQIVITMFKELSPSALGRHFSMILSSTHISSQGLGRPGEQVFRHVPKRAERKVRTPDPWLTIQSRYREATAPSWATMTHLETNSVVYWYFISCAIMYCFAPSMPILDPVPVLVLAGSFSNYRMEFSDVGLSPGGTPSYSRRKNS